MIVCTNMYTYLQERKGQMFGYINVYKLSSYYVVSKQQHLIRFEFSGHVCVVGRESNYVVV